MAPIWAAVFHLASGWTGSATVPARASLSPEIRNSRPRIATTAITGARASVASITNAAATRSLSAIGSRMRPSSEC